MERVVVVGASLAGFRAAEELRAAGFDGTIRMVGDEPHRPYNRPPLSKAVLAGAAAPESTAWKPASDDALDLDWVLGDTATGLDLAGRSVALASGSTLDFDGLVIATGASPVQLPFGRDLAGVHTLRTLDDSVAIAADLDRSPGRVLVVGAGFIGAEVAATCRRRGHDVTMVEPLSVPLERALGTEIGEVCARMHRDEGVDLRLGVGVADFRGGDRVEQVVLADGSVVEADVVVVGVGVRPNTAWLDSSGLTVDNGVVCDATCSAAPGVVAAGDVARWTNRRFGESMRIEHWDNAINMGAAAGRRLLQSDDEAEPFAPVPWFWSDQYDAKIQLAGRIGAGDDRHVIGSLTDEKFAVLHGRDGALTGCFAWSWPRQVATFQVMIENHAAWEEALAAAG